MLSPGSYDYPFTLLLVWLQSPENINILITLFNTSTETKSIQYHDYKGCKFKSLLISAPEKRNQKSLVSFDSLGTAII